MRILFVDAGQPSGGAYYRSCVKLVSRMVLTQQLVCDTELQLVEAAANNLEDYLYELETSRSSIVAMQNFQAVDLLFVVGDHRSQPWCRSMWNINCLIRMCLRSGKHVLLLSDSVFESLVFHLVSGLTTDVSLINTLNTRKSSSHKPIKKSDLLLNSSNGSLYAYNNESQEWYLKKHCGLIHLNRSSTNKSVEGKCPSRIDLKCTSNNQTVCQTQREHYLFQDVPHEFIVEQRSKWRVASEVDLARKCIGWSPQGISVIEYGNVLAIHFIVSKRHPETIQLLRNYVHRTLGKVFDEPGIHYSASKPMDKRKYLPTQLEIQKGRQIFTQKLVIENIVRDEVSKPRGYATRPKTVQKPARKTHQSSQHGNKEDHTEAPAICLTNPRDEFWVGPVIKIRQKKQLPRASLYDCKLKNLQKNTASVNRMPQRRLDVTTKENNFFA